jgi:hypothetical protein
MPSSAAVQAASKNCSENKLVLVSQRTDSRFEACCEVIVDAEMIEASRINRQRVFLREGPSPDYEIQTSALNFNQMVIVTYRLGSWVQVLEPESGTRGWLHQKTITQPMVSLPKDFKVPLARMPMVFTTRPIDSARDFGSRRSITVAFNKGKGFRSFVMRQSRVLVWNNAKGRPIWLKKGWVE